MAHIQLPENLPGILGPLAFRTETAKPLLELAETLLRGRNTLSSGERELIATYVSFENNCHFCHSSHGAAAKHHFGGDQHIVDAVREDFQQAPVSPKLKALLHIAGKVRESGKKVTPEDIARAKSEGASDIEIHDTVLIAAAFCMYNRYVDGLGTWAPEKSEEYDPMGQRLAEVGYLN